MPAPADSPLFATDSTFTVDGDAWGGDANKASPGPARIAEGFEPTTLPAEWLNWILANHGDYLVWLEAERARLSAYAGDSGIVLPAPVTWSRTLAASSAMPRVAANWVIDATTCAVSSGTNGASLVFDLTPVLQRDASIVSVAVLVDPALDGPRMLATLRKTVLGVTTGVPAITGTDEGTAQDSATPGHALQWITITPASPLPVWGGMSGGSPVPKWELIVRKGLDISTDVIHAARVVLSGSKIDNA